VDDLIRRLAFATICELFDPDPVMNARVWLGNVTLHLEALLQVGTPRMLARKDHTRDSNATAPATPEQMPAKDSVHFHARFIVRPRPC